ncbi:MAG: hypothetical protein LBK04_06580 [Clostridiales Family XIII bacterium]|jgi:dienelactone hydrolase|nr:hypothetical protein [Clostridiales Family XIII bacterium]
MKTYDAFPEPVGSYKVGRTQMDFEYTASDRSKRELTAFVFYPSDSDEGKPTSTYMFPETFELLSELPHITAVANGDEILSIFSIDIETRCYDDLALSEKERRYPVLFYVCGAGGSPERGTVVCTDLASTGYVVIAVGHQNSGMYKRKDGRLSNVSKEFSDIVVGYSSDPDVMALAGKMEMRPDEETAIEMCRSVFVLPSVVKLTKYAKLQAEDVRHIADCFYEMDAGERDSIFKGRLLLDAGIGVFGHSYGGSTSAMVCRDDDRFVCGAGFDSGAFGVLDSDIGKPFMLLFSDPNYNMNAVIGANNSAETWYFAVDGVMHYDYCDLLFTNTKEALRGERDAMEMRSVLTDYTKTFFDHCILQKAAGVEGLAFDGVEEIKTSKNK